MIVKLIEKQERTEIIQYLNEIGLLHKKTGVSDEVLRNVVEFVTGKEVFPHQAIYHLREFKNKHKGLPKLNRTPRKNPFRQKTLDLFGNVCMKCQKEFLDSFELKVVEIFDLPIVRELKVLNHQVVCKKCWSKYKSELRNYDLRFNPENFNRFRGGVQAILSPLSFRSVYWEDMAHPNGVSLPEEEKEPKVVVKTYTKKKKTFKPKKSKDKKFKQPTKILNPLPKTVLIKKTT